VPAEFIPYGTSYPDLNSERLTYTVARKVLSACLAHKEFDLIELRYLELASGNRADVIVVDCVNDQVQSHNKVGIKVRERLALVFTGDDISAPEVRPLRDDFPLLLHMQRVLSGNPSSICLYLEPWSDISRSWTPQKFLQRILWWLAQSAQEKLHPTEQRVEQFYFEAPHKLVLPPDFYTKIKDEAYALTIGLVKLSDGKSFKIMKGIFEPKATAQKKLFPETTPLFLTVTPVLHGNVEAFPNTLGELSDQLAARSILTQESISVSLSEVLKAKIPDSGRAHNANGRCLVILLIPICRTPEGEPERFETRAYFLEEDVTTLGESLGELTKHNGKFFITPILNGVAQEKSTNWRTINIYPIEIGHAATKDFAREASGISPKAAIFKGVIGGVGALGSTLMDLWSKEAWGEWAVVDHDIVEAHNVVRHLAKDFHVGSYKVEAVQNMVEVTYYDDHYKVVAIPDKINNKDNPKIQEALSEASLFVDASTTLEVPREFAQIEAPRSVSLFLTPSGLSSALLFEDSERKTRLDSLEAQYYRAILNSTWGKKHLVNDKSAIRIGMSCRDMSAVISHEAIQLHAAILAKQVRFLREKPQAYIKVWTETPETGALAAEEITVYDTIRTQCGEWQIVWDAGIQQKLFELRANYLPNETGGVIVGYIDQKLKAIYIVDVLPQPKDSQADQVGFTRGTEDLQATLDEIALLTSKVVGYIGEWHSHPPGASAMPSGTDAILLCWLADILLKDGDPALMVIAGHEEISLLVKGE